MPARPLATIYGAGRRGVELTPVSNAAPNPRACRAFKYWLSPSDERDPQKKSRDLAQAKAVYAVIQDRLPHLDGT
jgi:Nucleotidyltransferase